jgi:hypothetical protein
VFRDDKSLVDLTEGFEECDWVEVGAVGEDALRLGPLDSFEARADTVRTYTLFVVLGRASWPRVHDRAAVSANHQLALETECRMDHQSAMKQELMMREITSSILARHKQTREAKLPRKDDKMQ